MARVSVVVPAFQNAPFIEATMDSILGQTFSDLEVVVADHGSTDGTWDLLQRYCADPRVRLLRTERGGGAARNWNRVTEAATGEFVKLVCGDDLLYRDIVARQLAAFDSAVGAGRPVVLVASPRDILDASGRVFLRNVGLRGVSGRMDGREAVRCSVRRGTNVFGEPGCVLLRRDVLAAVGGWHGDPFFMIDQATYSRVLLHGDLVAVGPALAAFRLSAGQQSVGLARKQAASAAAMHADLAGLEPGLLSASDVRLGNAMAVVRAWQRRAAYAWMGRRMHHS